MKLSSSRTKSPCFFPGSTLPPENSHGNGTTTISRCISFKKRCCFFPCHLNFSGVFSRGLCRSLRPLGVPKVQDGEAVQKLEANFSVLKKIPQEVIWVVVSNVVLIGQVKQYFAYESRHQHGAFDMTGGNSNIF